MLVGEVAGVLLGRLERGASVGVRTSHAATGGDSVLGDRVPVAIDGVEVVAPVVGPALGVDAGVQVGTTGAQIGRPSCRARVCKYVWIPVVAGSCKTKTKKPTIQ